MERHKSALIDLFDASLNILTPKVHFIVKEILENIINCIGYTGYGNSTQVG